MGPTLKQFVHFGPIWDPQENNISENSKKVIHARTEADIGPMLDPHGLTACIYVWFRRCRTHIGPIWADSVRFIWRSATYWTKLQFKRSTIESYGLYLGKPCIGYWRGTHLGPILESVALIGPTRGLCEKSVHLKHYKIRYMPLLDPLDTHDQVTFQKV
jgi:hypothetical protein